MSEEGEGGGGSCVGGLLLGLNQVSLVAKYRLVYGLGTAWFTVLVLPGFPHGTSPCSLVSLTCAIIQPFLVFTTWNFKIHLHNLRCSGAKQCQGASLIWQTNTHVDIRVSSGWVGEVFCFQNQLSELHIRLLSAPYFWNLKRLPPVCSFD